MNRTRGFTLVELLVVIGIIAVLVSILLPSLNRARQSSERLTCMSNLRQIGVAHSLYANDNKGKFLLTSEMAATDYSGASITYVGGRMGTYPGFSVRPWNRALNRYLGSSLGPGDPAANDPAAQKSMFRIWSCAGDFVYDGISHYELYGSSYFYNAHTNNWTDWYVVPRPWRGLANHGFANIKNSSEIVLQMELAGHYIANGYAQVPWHGRTNEVNVCFVDGHVSIVVMGPDWDKGADRGNEGPGYDLSPWD